MVTWSPIITEELELLKLYYSFFNRLPLSYCCECHKIISESDFPRLTYKHPLLDWPEISYMFFIIGSTATVFCKVLSFIMYPSDHEILAKSWENTIYHRVHCIQECISLHASPHWLLQCLYWYVFPFNPSHQLLLCAHKVHCKP